MPAASKPRPLYQSTTHALAEILRQAAPGSALPSEPRLARQLGVSRSTLREAMRPFEQRGLISRRQGVGTFVSSHPRVIETGLEQLVSIQRLAARQGLQTSMGELQVVRRQPNPAEIEEAGGGGGPPAVAGVRGGLVGGGGGGVVGGGVGLQPGEVLLSLRASLYDLQGGVVDRSHSYFLPETFRFHVVRRIEPPMP